MNITESIPARDVDDDTMSVLSELSLPGGMMYDALTNARLPYRRRKNSRVFLAKWSGEIVGWGFANVRRYGDAHRMFADVGVFVKSSCRGHGVGRQILDEELKWIRESTRAIEIHAHPHDAKSPRLFVSAGIYPASFHVTYKVKVTRDA